MTKLTFLAVMLIGSNLYADNCCGLPEEPQHTYGYVLKPYERERRDEAIQPFLEVSIGTEGSASCSGTICYYDEVTKTAYVLTCGHCHRGKGQKVSILSYFVDGKKEKRRTAGEVIAWSGKEDLAIIKFKPDFTPKWIPIGLEDSPFFYPEKAPVGTIIVVTGRDGGLPDGNRDPSLYEAEIRKPSSDWYLESKQSQSRGGRSGGGVMTIDRKWLIGINHGRGGTVKEVGHGLWMPLHRIHVFVKKNNLGFLLKVGNLPQHIPVIDRNNPQGKYDKDYIPMPKDERDPVYRPLSGLSWLLRPLARLGQPLRLPFVLLPYLLQFEGLECSAFACLATHLPHLSHSRFVQKPEDPLHHLNWLCRPELPHSWQQCC